MSVDIPALVAEAMAAAHEAGLAVAVMGGCARNAYAEVRATKDVDLVAEVDEAGHAALLSALARRGFRPASIVSDEAEPVPDLVLFRDEGGRRIDVLYAHTDFERSALARRRTGEPYRDIEVPVISAEDLIVYKLLANRTQDRADIEDVVRAQRERAAVIDWGYIERWCDAWEIGQRLVRAREDLR